MYFCEKCNYTTEKLYCWKTHLQSKKHNEEKKEKYCKCCNYNAKTQKLYIQHLQSEKHKKNNEKMENSKIVEVKENNEIIEIKEKNEMIEMKNEIIESLKNILLHLWKFKTPT
jgi:hypothetical protein